MKGKKNIRILLPVVVIIWGIVIYKIVDAFSEDEVTIPVGERSAFVAKQVKEKETFSLMPIESDPFLGTIYKKKAPRNTTGGSGKPKTEVVWPQISYQGTVSDSEAKSVIYMIKIDSAQQLLRRGEESGEIKLIKGSSSAVTLKFKGETKEFSM